MARSCGSDVIGVLRGIRTVANSIAKHQVENVQKIVDNSSVKRVTEDNIKGVAQQISEIQLSQAPEKVLSSVKELLDRVVVVEKGITELAKHFTNEITHSSASPQNPKPEDPHLEIYDPAKDAREMRSPKTSEESSFQNVVNVSREYSSVKEKIENIGGHEKMIPKIELTDREKKQLRKLEMEHESRIRTRESTPGKISWVEKTEELILKIDDEKISDTKEIPRVKPKIKPKQTLSVNARERKVPSTRIQRMVSFGTLGIGLGIGTIAEYGRRTLGIKDQGIGESLDNAFLTKANAERIVSTLCKVRGAALKIGQILSIQDTNIISPEMQKVFERVRQSADFMPTWQVQQVLVNELGPDWSRKMKLLTGYESKVMESAHVDAVMILGEVFSEKNEKYNFGGQNVTKSMQKLVPTIISHRLCPPPEEIYSIHRKLSGVFLLCAKLNVKINCRELFQDVYEKYKSGCASS
ncbi:aarF domain-containing protein kinase 4 [Fopius arisanus]|uniref:AarF domain-containing protein kinase 4 n=1 Tax=Fopius arisanus TaxID=64838 RepID=A0A9R1T308_9HYME|nr:PREDICTED: aarF domain-containing protein kinase 4 [Fopius arisanus]